MTTLHKTFSWLCVCCLCTSLAGGHSARAQGATQQQLQTLIPDQQDLQGFIRVWPAGEFINPDGSSRAGVIEDQVIVDGRENEYHPGWATLPGQDGRMSQIKRSLYSESGEFHLAMTINICDAPEAAHLEVQEFLHACSTRFQQGTFSGASAIGDESWFNPSGYSTLIGRSGRVVFLIDGSRSFLASRRSNSPRFPEAAVEAVAYQILLRASQQAKLTGGTTQNTRLAVNGHALPQNALLVGKQTYVPVREFAKAMGLMSRWDTKTGALTLTGPKRKTVALTAGSTAVTVGGVRAAALIVPVLKDGGEPVMALADLLRLTGGRITGHAGNTVQVKG